MGPRWMSAPLLLALSIAVQFLPAVVCDNDRPGSASPCNTSPCWTLFLEAQDHYQSEVPGVSEPAIRQCATYRTYQSCLQDLYRRAASVCIADLGYQSLKKILVGKMIEHNCSESGPIYPEDLGPAAAAQHAGGGGRAAATTSPPRPPCSFRGRPVHRVCSLFGDPHLRTFGADYQTCRIAGAWPLIDNNFLTVQVSNEAIGDDLPATVVTQVTVIVHPIRSEYQSSSSCGPEEAIFYHADGGNLSSTFDDGLSEHGLHGSLSLRGGDDRVEIHLRYISTTVVVLRVAGRYLSVFVIMPEGVVNVTTTAAAVAAAAAGAARGRISGSGSDPPALQLCTDGCPRRERVDLAAILGRGAARASGGAAVGSIRNSGSSRTGGGSGGYSLQQAWTLCRETQRLSGYYLEACVFDVFSTGDGNATVLALQALEQLAHYFGGGGHANNVTGGREAHSRDAGSGSAARGSVAGRDVAPGVAARSSAAAGAERLAGAVRATSYYVSLVLALSVVQLVRLLQQNAPS